MKRIIMYAILALFLISVIGCANSATTATTLAPSTTLAQGQGESQATNPPPSVPTGGAIDTAVSEQDIQDVNNISQDLNSSDLDNVSNEIDSINW